MADMRNRTPFYGAVPTSKLNADHVFMADGSTLQDTINHTNEYSSNEVRVGTWTNGKPIYRQVISFNINSTGFSTAILHGIADVDEFIPTCTGKVTRTTGDTYMVSFIYPADSSSILTWSTSFTVSPTILTLYIGSALRDACVSNPAVFILEYTKTTDTAIRSLHSRQIKAKQYIKEEHTEMTEKEIEELQKHAAKAKEQED